MKVARFLKQLQHNQALYHVDPPICAKYKRDPDTIELGQDSRRRLKAIQLVLAAGEPLHGRGFDFAKEIEVVIERIWVEPLLDYEFVIISHSVPDWEDQTYIFGSNESGDWHDSFELEGSRRGYVSFTDLLIELGYHVIHEKNPEIPPIGGNTLGLTGPGEKNAG